MNVKLLICFAMILFLVDTISASTLVVYKTYACKTGDLYFSTIRDAVMHANDGDTIIVCPGTYTENVDVDKSVEICSYSQNPSDTIVNADDPHDSVFYVTADNVTIKGFTVTGATAGCFWTCFWKAGIFLYNSNNCKIENINASNNWHGIFLLSSSNNIIANNNISNNKDGIYLWGSDNNIIANNTFLLNGMFVYDSYNNKVTNNTVNGKPLVYLENVNDYVVGRCWSSYCCKLEQYNHQRLEPFLCKRWR